MVYRSDKANPYLGQPDPLRRLPASQSSGSLRRTRHGQSSLPPAALRKPESRPQSRPQAVPRVPLERAAEPTLDADARNDIVEVMQIGCWSVRRNADGRPIFVNMNTGLAQEEPPEEVLRELASDVEPEGNSLEARDDAEPSFRRIVLGNHREVPLMMARDILAALREDVSLFDELQTRFSDTAAEPALELGTLPQELTEVAAGLSPHELSGIIATDVGMHMLLRVS